MNCLQAEEHFSAHFEDELDYQTLQAFEAHLAGCEGCRHEYALFQESVKAAQQLPQIDASPYFMQTLQQRLAEEHREKLPFWQGLLRVLNKPRWVFSGIILLIFATTSLYLYQENLFDKAPQPTAARAAKADLHGGERTRSSSAERPSQPALSDRQLLPRDVGGTRISNVMSAQPLQQHYVLKTVSYASAPTRGGL